MLRVCSKPVERIVLGRLIKEAGLLTEELGVNVVSAPAEQAAPPRSPPFPAPT